MNMHMIRVDLTIFTNIWIDSSGPYVPNMRRKVILNNQVTEHSSRKGATNAEHAIPELNAMPICAMLICATMLNFPPLLFSGAQ